jgi:hypothetical protein
MKVRLLKKVRKRFKIIHLPNGFIDYQGHHYDVNLFQLTDRNTLMMGSEYYAQLGIINKNSSNKNTAITLPFTQNIFYTERDCIAYLKRVIIDILRKEGYRGRKDKKIMEKYKRVF